MSFWGVDRNCMFMGPFLSCMCMFYKYVLSSGFPFFTKRLLFLKLYFTDYAITVVPIFYVCPLPPGTLYSLRQSLHHCSCPWVMCISSLATPFSALYFISPWLFCNYLFVLLNPLTSSPILLHPPPIWQPSKHSLCP